MSDALGGLDLPPVTAAGVSLGLAVLLIGLLLGQLVRLLVSRAMLWRGRGASSADVLGRLASWLVGLLAVAASLAITFPSIQPVNLLGGIGIISIAAGIAFQTVLGNMFAGIVILTRDRFRVGDQISVLDHRGTIVQMGLTSTSIRAFDGRLVLVPNATLHSEVVTVRTGFEQVRSSVVVDLADTGDLEHAAGVAVRAMTAVPEVLDDPSPEAFLTSVGTTTAQLELRFWSGARQLETKEATHAVILAVLAAFAAEGVEAGAEVHTVDVGPRLARMLDR
ncbi:mechanosensitive ion channel family protein [Ornithinimicrobium pratense]|uniref:Mechanosensitive ion channel n=1 Tax=Ornithinimicrobium pratense TaxID=2593973 RepID=A0A5J6V8T4_9MICO|nr:mechanosensitive ion channel domain-containing protein [Ornithinimicrobium pratense]QFG69586.1 mechanosensitive ion channel [Ornithinimicrobium pratense]